MSIEIQNRVINKFETFKRLVNQYKTLNENKSKQKKRAKFYINLLI